MKKYFDGWPTPKWHKDWGDPEVDVSLFKKLCNQLLELSPDFRFEVDPVEEGYIVLTVFLKKMKIFDAQLVDRETEKLGLFFENEEEVYLSDPSEIIEYIKDYLSYIIR